MSSPRTIHTVLVANRGEIARRVFRTASAMGMRTVAVYVDADADAPFVAEADEAVRLPDTYLDADAIIAAALVCGADAVHPGYGFLSENAGFATAVEAAGMAWIGPQPEVISLMGDKIRAKEAAVAAGVPTLPSSNDPTDDKQVGYPLLVKASAGGGGKGMRIVEQAGDLADSVAAARREALSGFGDDTVFLERYVPRSRHIEIQILGDAHGTLVHLGERECSIQRRHQKIIEESPSPIVDNTMRSAMGDAALALAGALDYRSAGTVEFLVDDASREFFFLEVNTRLQVEHPVTEEVTGIDLVRQQLRVAAGEPLDFAQLDVDPVGHAIEARLYAEDPAAGFLPATGTLEAFLPSPDPVVRWDNGVVEGSQIGVSFDPMIAKVTAHGPTRSEAATKLALALERLHLGGLTTNRDFLAATLRSDAFLAGDTTTDFIERIAPESGHGLDDDHLQRYATIAALWLQGRNRSETPVLATLPTGWRNARLPAEHKALRCNDQDFAVHHRTLRDGSFALGAAGDEGRARVLSWSPTSISCELDDRRLDAQITATERRVHLQTSHTTLTFELLPRFAPPESEAPSGGLVAPMPGVVLDVRAVVGDRVTAGQTLVVLEAMKMEHHMNAAADGVVVEVLVATGDQVDNGAVLLVVESDSGGVDGSGEAGS